MRLTRQRPLCITVKRWRTTAEPLGRKEKKKKTKEALIDTASASASASRPQLSTLDTRDALQLQRCQGTGGDHEHQSVYLGLYGVDVYSMQ